MGAGVGAVADGDAVGAPLVGASDGALDGLGVGLVLGTADGASDGLADGASVGEPLGTADGASDGDAVGADGETLGAPLGASLGESLGAGLGLSLGDFDGAYDGLDGSTVGHVARVGVAEGRADGVALGLEEGRPDGLALGALVHPPTSAACSFAVRQFPHLSHVRSRQSHGAPTLATEASGVNPGPPQAPQASRTSGPSSGASRQG